MSTNSDSHGSGSTTILIRPSTPLPDRGASEEVTIEPDPYNGDFARLEPQNRPARLAFHEVVEKAKATPDEYSHILKYMYVSPERHDIDGDMTQSETDTDTERTPQPGLWTGYYRFNMDILPSNYRLGWVVGRGRLDLDNGGVDLRLTTSKYNRVAGRHARFYHNSAGILMIRSDDKRVLLDGKEEFRNDKRAITSPVTAISFGDLAYILCFTNLSKYAEQLSQLRKENGESYEPPPFLVPTPSLNDFVLQHYAVKGVFAQGSTCTVSSGFNRRTGALVAIKKIKVQPHNAASIAREVRLHKALCPHPRICELVETIRLKSPARLELVEEMYLIYSPLAERRLRDVIFSDMNLSNRTVIFKHVTEAVGYIHGKGIMHRDIKPENIAILSSSPPEARLIDFGSATESPESSDHMVGTIRYLSPEVMLLKNSGSGAPYNRATDIWSLGISMYQLFCKKSLSWKYVETQPYGVVLDELTAQCSTVHGPFKLIKQMIAWLATDRPSASQILDLLGEDPASKRKQKRDASGSKRHKIEE